MGVDTHMFRLKGPCDVAGGGKNDPVKDLSHKNKLEYTKKQQEKLKELHFTTSFVCFVLRPNVDYSKCQNVQYSGKILFILQL